MLLNEIMKEKSQAPSCRCGGVFVYTKKNGKNSFEHKCNGCGAKISLKEPTEYNVGRTSAGKWDHVGKRG